MSWLPDDFVHPVHVPVPTTTLHLRPIREADTAISWWVVDDLVGGEAERALDTLVLRWIADDWPFQQPRYLGRDITWPEWLALPRPA
ncbi:hypothetical protein [Micromonospora sp. NPDC048898]|uniref:hypothetical protein n=1 Tax=Micromonospora sp. NPDC048898 TaxID=3364260 RepID=UPI00371C8F13